MITVICSTKSIDTNYEKMLRSSSGIKDEDLDALSEHINAIVEVLQRYGK